MTEYQKFLEKCAKCLRVLAKYGIDQPDLIACPSDCELYETDLLTFAASDAVTEITSFWVSPQDRELQGILVVRSIMNDEGDF